MKLRYKVNVSTTGIAENREEDEYVGAAAANQRIIGFALELEGADAGQYELNYAARLKGRKTLAKAKNGAWCGTANKTGKTVEAVLISLKKK